MVQGYHTLAEAARILAMSEDELKRMAQKNEIRSFQDRGTLRFRVQDVQELARQRGGSSDLDMPIPSSLPKTPPTNPAAGPKSSPKSPQPKGPKAPVLAKTPAKGSTNFYPAVGEGTDEDMSLEIPDDRVDIGQIGSGKLGSSKHKKPTPGSDSDVRLVTDGDVSLTPGTDSDVRLVSQDLPVTPKKSYSPGPLSSGPRLNAPMSPVKPKTSMGPVSPVALRPTGLHTPRPVGESGNIKPMDSDSDVKIVGARSGESPLDMPDPSATDSDIRIERYNAPPAGNEAMLLTEEINLDEELQKQDAALAQQPPQAKIKQKSKMSAYPVSPFELSDHDAGIKPPSGKPGSGKQPSGKLASGKLGSGKLASGKLGSGKLGSGKLGSGKLASGKLKGSDESSDLDLLPLPPAPHTSDLDLVPTDDGPFALDTGSGDDFSLELPEESDMSLAIEDSGVGLKGPTSGINLAEPNDAGLSLEEAKEPSDMDFELSADAGATPRPAPQEPLATSDDSGSEFELSLDDSSGESPHINLDESSGEASPLAESSESEFEFTLDSSSSEEMPAAPAAGEEDSGSEFELTLDDSGQIEAPAADGAAEEEGEGGDKDIFETDFEVPALDDESGSQVASLESESESSDFELALDDSDIEVDEGESESKVVALDDEEADDAASTVAAKAPPPRNKTKVQKGAAAADLDEDMPDFSEMSLEETDEAAEEGLEKEVMVETRDVVRYLRPAPWGVVPVIFMIPCLIVMVVVALLGFEMTQSIAGHRPPGMLTKLIAKDLLQLEMK